MNRKLDEQLLLHENQGTDQESLTIKPEALGQLKILDSLLREYYPYFKDLSSVLKVDIAEVEDAIQKITIRLVERITHEGLIINPKTFLTLMYGAIRHRVKDGIQSQHTLAQFAQKNKLHLETLNDTRPPSELDRKLSDPSALKSLWASAFELIKPTTSLTAAELARRTLNIRLLTLKTMGFSDQEIAEQSGKSENAISTHRYRLKQKIMQFFDINPEDL